MDSTDSASGGPVFRVGLTSKITLRTLNRMICEFYGHPGTDRANAARLASYAVDCVVSGDTRIGVIDDIHFINPAHKDGLDVSNHLKWLATPQPPPTGLPDLLLRAVQGQSSGWTRLERFAVTMTHPSIDAAAATIGISRTTLIQQLHRLETDLSQQLYHRAPAAGVPQRPTTPGATLLNILDQPNIQQLRATRARLPRINA